MRPISSTTVFLPFLLKPCVNDDIYFFFSFKVDPSGDYNALRVSQHLLSQTFSRVAPNNPTDDCQNSKFLASVIAHESVFSCSLFCQWFVGIRGSPGPNSLSPLATMLVLPLDCSTVAPTTPQKVLPIWKMVELKIADFSDRTRTGISILTSAAHPLFCHVALPMSAYSKKVGLNLVTLDEPDSNEPSAFAQWTGNHEFANSLSFKMADNSVKTS